MQTAPGSIAFGQQNPRSIDPVLMAQIMSLGNKNMGVTQTGVDQSFDNTISSSSEKVPLDSETEAMLRSRMEQSPEYAAILNAQAAEAATSGNYADYLRRSEQLDPYLRAAATAGRGIASITGDKSYGEILGPVTTPEQKAADLMKLNNESSQRALSQSKLLDDFIKGRLVDKATVTRKFGTVNTDTSKLDLGSKTPPPPRVGGGRKENISEAMMGKFAALNEDYNSMLGNVETANEVLGKYPINKTPGIGSVESALPNEGYAVAELFGSTKASDAIKIKNALKALSAFLVYNKSGKAVTKQEFENFQRMVSGGRGADEKLFRETFAKAKKWLDESYAFKKAGFKEGTQSAVLSQSPFNPSDRGASANPPLTQQEKSVSDKYKQKAQTERMKKQ
jgi:hypothetical protein